MRTFGRGLIASMEGTSGHETLYFAACIAPIAVDKVGNVLFFLVCSGKRQAVTSLNDQESRTLMQYHPI
jgi:hypothetical protein